MGVRGLLGLPNPPNKVQSILTQAALGSTVPVASRAINAGRTAIGEQMYRGALSPKPSAIRDYPDLIEYGQKNAQAEVTKIGGGRAQTADRIEKEMAHDVKVLHDALTDASKAGHTVKLARITEALHRLRNSHLPAAGAVGSDNERAAEKILEEISKLRRSLPRDVPLDLAQLTKQNSADRASALYDAMKGAGGAADMDSPTMEKIHKTIADVIRNQVRAIPVHGEKIEAANKALQADMALVKALKDASLKGDPKFSPDFTKPASLYPITRNTESKLGIMAEKPAVKIAGEGAARISALFPWLNSPNKERKPKEESK